MRELFKPFSTCTKQRNNYDKLKSLDYLHRDARSLFLMVRGGVEEGEEGGCFSHALYIGIMEHEFVQSYPVVTANYMG